MLKSSDFSEEELLKKREEAERKARRGEIDPVQEYTFSLISKITGLPRPAILNFMFEQPLILDELDLLYKTDTKKRVIFYYQVIMISRDADWLLPGSHCNVRGRPSISLDS